MSQSINLEIEAEVLTSGGLAEISASILEFLLYQRNQIDFVYSTFRNFVNEWLVNEFKNPTLSASSMDSLHGYKLNRQREKAIETKESVSAMRKLIEIAFETYDIKSLRFLFGSTISTPKEAYTLNLPIASSSCLHLNDHHRLRKMNLNRLLLSLIAHEDLNVIFSKNLCPTNIFLEFEMLKTSKNAATKPLENAFPTVDKTQLPRSCKHIYFDLQQKTPAGFEFVNLNCCRMLEVFNGECMEKTNESGDQLLLERVLASTWWESEIIIRGFREKLVNGQSIWNK